MALSETIQESVCQGYPITVFLSPGCAYKGVSIGKEQRIEYLNLQACNEDDLKIVRRPTEGYVVVHYTDDVTYGIAVPRDYTRNKNIKSKTEFDDIISPALIRSLERIKVPNGYDPFPERYGNIFINRRKISGSAQSNNRTVWLQHGIISMRRHEAEDYVRYINGEKDTEKIRAQITSIEEEGGIVNSDKLVALLDEEFSRQLLELGIEFKRSYLSPEELEYAEELTRTKYETNEWSFSGIGRYSRSGRIGCFTWEE